MQPLLKYPGGKRRELKYLTPFIPTSYNRYIEPFFGGGALYFHLQPKRAIITDTAEQVIAFYKTVRDNFTVFKHQLTDLEMVWQQNYDDYLERKKKTVEKVANANEDLYYYCRDLINKVPRNFDTEVAESSAELLPAVAYYYVNKMAFAGQIRYNKKGQFNIPYGHYTHFNTSEVTEQYSKLLKTAEILEAWDYHQAFEMARPDDFMFLDPPYDSAFTQFKADTPFTEADQYELAKSYKKLNCPALLIINKTKLTEELYKDYAVRDFKFIYNTNIKNRYERGTTHLVVTNYTIQEAQ